MFTLIKREIEDNFAYFLAAALFAAMLVFSAFTLARDYFGQDTETFAVLLPLLLSPIIAIGFMTMGASQMINDKNRKVSAFLSTLPVTRTQVLLARVTTGALAIGVLLLPLLVTTTILFRLYVSPYVLPHHYIIEIFTTVFLVAFASYCIGLQIGLTTTKAARVLSIFILPALVMSLFFIKGFALNIIVLLLLLIAASLVRTWQKFLSIAL